MINRKKEYCNYLRNNNEVDKSILLNLSREKLLR